MHRPGCNPSLKNSNRSHLLANLSEFQRLDSVKQRRIAPSGTWMKRRCIAVPSHCPVRFLSFHMPLWMWFRSCSFSWIAWMYENSVEKECFAKEWLGREGLKASVRWKEENMISMSRLSLMVLIQNPKVLWAMYARKIYVNKGPFDDSQTVYLLNCYPESASSRLRTTFRARRQPSPMVSSLGFSVIIRLMPFPTRHGLKILTQSPIRKKNHEYIL